MMTEKTKNILLVGLAFVLPFLIITIDSLVLHFSKVIMKIIDDSFLDTGFSRALIEFGYCFGLSIIIIAYIKFKPTTKIILFLLLLFLVLPASMFFGLLTSCYLGNVCL